MAFIKTIWNPEIGEKVITTKKFTNSAGYFEVGTIVTITGKSNRGYDFKDEKGNTCIECGFTGFKPLSSLPN